MSRLSIISAWGQKSHRPSVRLTSTWPVWRRARHWTDWGKRSRRRVRLWPKRAGPSHSAGLRKKSSWTGWRGKACPRKTLRKLKRRAKQSRQRPSLMYPCWLKSSDRRTDIMDSVHAACFIIVHRLGVAEWTCISWEGKFRIFNKAFWGQGIIEDIGIKENENVFTPQKLSFFCKICASHPPD